MRSLVTEDIYADLHAPTAIMKIRNPWKRLKQHNVYEVCEESRMERASRKKDGTWRRDTKTVLEIGDRMTIPLAPQIEPTAGHEDVEAKYKFNLIRLSKRKDIHSKEFQMVFGPLFEDVDDEKANEHWEVIQKRAREQLLRRRTTRKS